MELMTIARIRLAEYPVITRNTLGEFISAELQKREMSNRTLATGAGVAEGVIRNLRQHGLDPSAKDPDPRTLRAVADYLGIDALKLFRLAGYIPPEQSAFSVRAEFVAGVFDRLPPEKQDAVMGVLEALTESAGDRAHIADIRADINNPLAGFDLNSAAMLREAANVLIAKTNAHRAAELDDPDRIDPTLVLFPNSLPWSTLPESSRQRVLGLAKAKLNLNYDPTMVDPDWRR